jgi:uncharacterized repeat protein (TIGR03803 family)
MKRLGGSIAAILLLATPVVRADLITVGTFSNVGLGMNPYGGLTLSQDGSTLYGTASDGGGGSSYGTIFSVPIAGGSPSVLSYFVNPYGAGSSGGATKPFGSLTRIGSTLYGTSQLGGYYGQGTVFSVPITGGLPNVLASFNGTDGIYPYGSLTLSADGSTFYGTTFQGGSANKGTVFSVPVTGGTPTVLANFDGTHGADPQFDSLLLVGSTLYGTTRFGGSANKGTVFSVPVTGGTPRVLVNFTGRNGENPMSSLTLSQDGSTLYGTTFSGGSGGAGVVYSVRIAGGGPRVLANFDARNGNGGYIDGPLTLVGSTLYGTTSGGGTANDGTVFSLPVTGGTPTILGNFIGPGVPNSPGNNNGASPEGPLLLVGPNLYGTTVYGGTADSTAYYGSVFSLSLGPSVSTPVAPNGSYAGLQLTTTGTSPTTAAILAGTVQDGQNHTVTMAYAPALVGIAPVSGTASYGDPVQVTGTGNDPFVLEMSYSGNPSNPYLGWYDAVVGDPDYGRWVNAVLGNIDPTGANRDFDFTGNLNLASHNLGATSFADASASWGSGLSPYLGYFGYDPAAHKVWAVLDHNSGYVPLAPNSPASAVPEPTSVVLWVVGGLACWRYGVGAKGNRNGTSA